MHEFMEFPGAEMDQTPKGHPELAGRGVEYGWGKGTMTLRHTNDYSINAAAFEMRVHDAFAIVTSEHAQRFLLKANDNKRAPVRWQRGLCPLTSPRMPTSRSFAKSTKPTAAPLARTKKFIALA